MSDADRRAVAAQALRDAADALSAPVEIEPKHLTGGFVRGLFYASKLVAMWLRARARRIEAGSLTI